MDYTGDVYEASGKVTAKTKYLDGHQVVYLLEISLVFGSTTETVDFWCSYSTWTAVRVGDVVQTTYQQVSDGYISLNSVTK